MEKREKAAIPHMINRDLIEVGLSGKDEENQKEIKVFLEMQGPGIRENIKLPEYLAKYDPKIEKDTEVVLIAPGWGEIDRKDEFFVPNVHNGLYRIRAYLYDRGINSIMVCADIDDVQKAWDQIAVHKPPFLAFSPYYDSTVTDLGNMIKARELSQDSVIIAGGFEASLNMQWNSLGKIVDILVRGEGELPMQELVKRYREYRGKNDHFNKLEFLEYLRKSVEAEDIPGISITDINGNFKYTYLKNRIDPELYQEINLIAFDKQLSLSPIEKYWKISRWMFGGKKDSFFRFTTSDHCPYKCNFCQSSVYYAKTMGKVYSPVRQLSPENVLKIIKSILKEYPFINGILIDDENFLINRSRAVEIINLIIENRKNGGLKENIQFQCRTRTDQVDSEICRLLKEAGFFLVSVGSESYSARELEFMNKNTTPEQNFKAVKILIDHGIRVAENYILYTPETTADTFFESASKIVRNIRDFDIDGAVNMFLSPLPSTSYWGDGEFEIIEKFPYQGDLFKGKIMLRNKKNGYECIGEQIKVPGTDIVLPHPEVVLINEPIMRKASLDALLYLYKTVDKLKKISPNSNMSRSFLTLANLSATCTALYNLTGEPRWTELNNQIEEIIVNQGSVAKRENKIVAFCE